MSDNDNWPPCQVDGHGLNTAIEGHVLDDQSMRAAGFNDNNNYATWYYHTCLDRNVSSKITFNVSIPKDGSRLTIDVLDETFLQPYDYQYILHRHPHHLVACCIRKAVERQMTKLTEAGIVSGHVPGDYI